MTDPATLIATYTAGSPDALAERLRTPGRAPRPAGQAADVQRAVGMPRADLLGLPKVGVL